MTIADIVASGIFYSVTAVCVNGHRDGTCHRHPAQVTSAHD